MEKSATAASSTLSMRPAVVVDESSGDITIAVMARGLTEIVLKADGDVQVQGRSIIDDIMPSGPLFLDGDC